MAGAVLIVFMQRLVEDFKISLEFRDFVKLELCLQAIGGVFKQNVRLLIKRTEQGERDVPSTKVAFAKVIVHRLKRVDNLIDSDLCFVLVCEKNALRRPAQVACVGAFEVAALLERAENTVVTGIVVRSLG